MSDKSILVVDDDPDIRLMLVDLLQSYGYDVRTACKSEPVAGSKLTTLE